MFDSLKKDKFRVRAITWMKKGEPGHTSHSKEFKKYGEARKYFEQIIKEWGKDCKVERSQNDSCLIKGKGGFVMSIDFLEL